MRTILLSSVLIMLAGLVSFGQDKESDQETIIIAKIKQDNDTDKKIIEIISALEGDVQRLVDSLVKAYGDAAIDVNVLNVPGLGGNSPFNWMELDGMGDLGHIFEMGDQMKVMNMEDIADIRELQWMGEDKPFLGVIIDTDEKIERGIHVMNIVEESAAEAAGIMKDDILLAISDHEINSLEDLVEALSDHKVDDEISLLYSRDGKEDKTTAILKSRAESNYDLAKSFNIKMPACCEGEEECIHHAKKEYKAFVHKQKPKLGVHVEDLDEEMITDLKVKSGKGVLVTKVLEETAANKMGLKVNDVILSLDNSEISDVASLHEVLSEQKLGDEIEITYLRYGQQKKAKGVLFEFNHHSAIDEMIFYKNGNN